MTLSRQQLAITGAAIFLLVLIIAYTTGGSSEEPVAASSPTAPPPVFLPFDEDFEPLTETDQQADQTIAAVEIEPIDEVPTPPESQDTPSQIVASVPQKPTPPVSDPPVVVTPQPDPPLIAPPIKPTPPADPVAVIPEPEPSIKNTKQTLPRPTENQAPPAIVLQMKQAVQPEGTDRRGVLQQAVYPVTQRQLNTFLIANDIPPVAQNPSGDPVPAAATFEQAVAFTAWLTIEHRRAGLITNDVHYRLPLNKETKAERIWKLDESGTLSGVRMIAVFLVKGAQP